jgi:hypothetical protein
MHRNKIDSWPQAIVVTAGVLVTGAVVVALAFAGWSSEAIIGFGTLAIGVFAGQYVQTRKTAQIEAKTDQQSEQLATIVEQTNGKTEAELDEIADRAALRVIEAYRRGGLR